MPSRRFFRTGTTFAILLAGGILAGCSITPASIAQISGIEGAWISQNGVSTTYFSRGTFETKARADSQRLAHGAYSANPDGSILMNMQLINGASTTAICRLATSSRLDCVNEGARPFTLERIAAR